MVMFILIGCGSGNKKTETHLDKLDWQKQLAEAQKNNDYGSCQEVVVAAYLDNNKSVLDKAADICWPIGKNDPKIGIDFASMVVTTKEEYIEMVGSSLSVTVEPDKQ